MKGRIIDFSFWMNRKCRVTLELDADFREGYEKLKNTDLDINIKKWRKRRSLDANAYFHLLVNEIAMAQGLGDEEVKRQLVIDYGTIAKDEDGNTIGFKLPIGANVDDIYPYTRFFKQVEENGKLFNCYLVYKRTHLMDTAEMSRLIDGTVQEARELGIDTDTPDQKTRWNYYEERVL